MLHLTLFTLCFQRILSCFHHSCLITPILTQLCCVRDGSRGVDWVASHRLLWGRLSLKLREGTIIKVILSLTVSISFCQVSHPSFKNPGSATVCNIPGRNPIQDPSGFSRILQDQVSSHRMLPRILNGTVFHRILLGIL